LILNLDAADPSTVSGSTWTNKAAGVAGAEASATIVGSPTYDASEGAFSLNGTNQFFTLGSTNYLFNGALPFTVNLSFKASDPNKDNCLISNFNGGVGATYLFRLSGGVLQSSRNIAPWEVIGTTQIPAGEIQYASYSFDGSNMRLYLNGNLYATSALINGSVSHNGGARIGACMDSSSTSRLFKGQIYNAQIYNRALSLSEIATNYDNLAPGRLVTKSNYTLGAWNTEANGTGTSFGSLNTDLAALPTPHFRVSAENYSGGTLSASVGGSNLSITKIGTPVLNSSSGGGFGANARFPTISGAPDAGFLLGNAEVPNYTFCGMARYKDLDTGVRSTRGRIFAYGSGTNWLSGWYNGGTRNFFHNAWMLGEFSVGDPRWHVVCDSGNEIYWDGVKQTVTKAAYTSLPPLAINRSASSDNSHFEFTEAIVYNQALSAAQINTIFRYFENKFGLTDIVTTAQSAARFVPPSNYASPGDTTLQATWVSQVTYDGNKQTAGIAPSTQTVTNAGGTVASVGTLARTGYVFAGWNTAANGSGTRYAPGAALTNDGNKLLYAQWVVPVALPNAAINPTSLSPYMRLEAPNYDSINKIWRDSSGNSRNVTRVIGTPTITTTTGNGASKSFQTIAGGTADKFYFDNDPISTNWTVLALSRYSGASNRARILSGNYSGGAYQDSSGNWLMGHWGGRAAVAHFNDWLANSSTTPAGFTETDWVMSTGIPYNYRYNGVLRGSSGGTAVLPPIGINTYTGEQSDYQVAEVIIFDRTLSSSEIAQVEDYFDERYGLSYAKVGSYRTANSLAIGAGVGGRSDTFTAIDGLGNKTFSISPIVSGITLDTSTANGVAVVVGPLVPSGTYIETITATDQAGFTSSHILTITVSSAVKFDTNTATSLITTSGRAARLQLNTVNGVGAKVFSMTQTSAQTSPWITLDTSTAASGFATLRVDTFTAPGIYTISAVVTDSTNLRSTYIVTITVNAPPTLSSTSTIVTAPVLTDLRVNLDAGNPLSYAGSGATWTDLSGNSRNGTLQSSPTFSNSNGGNLNFNGSTQFVSVPSVRSEVFTVEAWVKFNALNNNYACVVTNNYSADKINYALCFWGNSTIRAAYHQAGTSWVGGQTGAFTPVVGTWYQLVYKVEKVGLNYIGSLYANGNLVAGQTTSTIAPGNDQLSDRIGRRWDSGEYINGSIPIVRIYSRALSDAEIRQNYNAISPRFLNSPTNSVALSTTQGVATSTSIYYAGLGTGAKTFTISPSIAGVTLDTSTINTVKVNYANTLTSTDSATAKTITQTITALDSSGQIATTPLYVTTTVNPPIVVTASIPNTLTTTVGLTAYDTFTATRGAGGPYTFTVTSSAYQSAFTMTKPSANVGLLTVANNLPAGTYYETITATDSNTASTSYLLTVIINPGMSLTPVGGSTLTTTITKTASVRVNIANGTGSKTVTISSPNSGITLDASTISSGYVTINVASNVPANTYSVSLTATDAAASRKTETFTIIVNKWPKIGDPAIVTSGLQLSLDAGNSSSYSGTGTTWNDLSGNGRNGSWQSTPVFSTNSGGLLTIGNSTAQYMSRAGLPAFATFTAETWVKFNSIPTGDNCVLSDKYNAVYINLSICFNNASQIVGGYWNNSYGWVKTAATTGITTNTWYHFVYTVSVSGSTYTSILYQNGVAVGSPVTSTNVPSSGSTGFLVGTNWRADTTVVAGEVAAVRIYNRPLSSAEAVQNFNAQGNRFIAANSGTDSATVTQGVARTITSVTSSEGSGTKTFTLSNLNTGITIDTSTANSFTLNLANTLTSTSPTVARTLTETVTATDASLATTTRVYTITVNPPVRVESTTGTITTTSGILAFDTLTATQGTGAKTFVLTGTPSTSGFTLTQSSNQAVLRVETTANPGTYTLTITATDSVGAVTSIVKTVVVNAPPTIQGSESLTATAGYAFTSPIYSSTGGTGTRTYLLTAGTGITLSATTGSPVINVGTGVVAGTYNLVLRVTDSATAFTTRAITLIVNPPVNLDGNKSLSKVYGDPLAQVYRTSSGTAPFTIFASSVCTTEKSTYIGDGNNGSVLGQSYTVEKFSGVGSCNWNVPSGVTSVSSLVVGGGGGGGGGGYVSTGSGGGGGGGGGGGVLTDSRSVAPGAVVGVAVGAGGALGTPGTSAAWNGNNAGNGGTSSIFGLTTAVGGGGFGAGIDASTGLCTSGRAWTDGSGGYGGNSGSNLGGAKTCAVPGGGGGGASSSGAGGAPSSATGGSGAAGITSSISGSSVVYGVGGRGADASTTGGNGSIGVTPGSGGSGGIGRNGATAGSGGKGSDGIVFVRYLTPEVDTSTLTMTTLSTNPTGAIQLNAPSNLTVGTYTQTVTVTDANGSTGSTPVTITLTVTKATPTLALSLPGSVTTAKYGNAVSISAAASTSGRVSFKDGTNTITGCESVTATSGIATCSWTPSVIGSRTITAKLTPTDTVNYNSSADTTFSVTVAKADSLTVTASDESFNFTNSAALVTKRFTLSGLVSIDTLTAVSMIYSGTANDSTSYSSSTAPTLAGRYAITPDTSTAGISTISGNYVSVLVVTGTLLVNRIAPTTSFTFANSNTVTYAPNATLAATANSRSGDGARTYSTDTSSKCSISDTPTVSVLEAGSCIVNMIVAQSANYLTKTDSATITINKASRTISLTSSVASLKYTDTATVSTTISGGASDGTITYGLNANPACSFDALGGVLTATAGTGTCTVTADISEGTNYLANTVAGTFSQAIAKADAPTIVIDTVTAVDYVPGVRAQISPTYTISGFKGTDAASSLTLTYSFVSNPFETFSYSDTRTPIDAGTYSIMPSAIVMSTGLSSNYETPNYAGAAINFTVNRIAQDPITIDGTNGEVDVPFTLVYRGGNNPTATATFTKVSGDACTVSGNGLNASAAGVCVVTVTVPANRNYLAITSDSISVRVRSFSLVPVFIFGNGTTGISISTTTPLTTGNVACVTGCTPKITAINPYEGAEGDVITLAGINFTGAIRVIFNVFTNAVTFSVDSDTQITVQIPAGLTAGDGAIEVVTPGGTTPRWYDFGVLP
jgi:hypothetical protein